MATPIKGKLIPFEKEYINRLTNGNKDSAEDFFGAGEPLKPVAPASVKGRVLDYPTGFNLNYTPRRESQTNTNIDFQTLRRVADPTQGGLDVVRLCIETIKDTICGIDYEIITRQKNTEVDQAKIDAIMRRLEMPDGQNSWPTWIRPIIEDHLVCDQPCIYIRKQPDGQVSLDVMDGALIKLLIDPSGRSPKPPHPCYQQQIKGLPAVDYTSDELIVPIYNRRSNHIYGYSKVEQIITTINLGLRRQLSMLSYWSAGNIPDMLIGVPESWSVSQLQDFQSYFDSILQGNISERRKARFIPSDTKPYPILEPPLKGEIDEWITRIIAYCFSVPHEWAVKEMNRATAETSANTAKEQGLEPIKRFIESTMNELLIKAFDAPELKFQFREQKTSDAKKQMEILQIAVGSRIMTVDEARQQLGLAPMEQEQGLEFGYDEFRQNQNALQFKNPTPFGDPIEEEDTDEEELDIVLPVQADSKMAKKKRHLYKVFPY